MDRWFGLLIVKIYIKHAYKNVKKENYCYYDIDDPLFLFGIYYSDPKSFNGWLLKRKPDRPSLINYQESYFEFIKEMVEDVYPNADPLNVAYSCIYRDDDDEVYRTVSSMMPNFDMIYKGTVLLVTIYIILKEKGYFS